MTRNKPTYVVPSMNEIRAIPWNGFSVVSTFSGGGGSSLGYRMAGFRVLLANEFVESARETYRENCSSETIVDPTDIRQLTGARVLQQIGLARGELDILDGSPPCASFSTAGKREKGWGKVKRYSDVKQRTDDLFYEFARLIEELSPKAFVAENVSGLVKGKAKGYFIKIIERLRSCGYRVRAKLLDAKWLGVPQSRVRLIFIGVRDDLDMDPVFPKPQLFFYSLEDACPWMRRETDCQEPHVEPETSMEGYAIGRMWHTLREGEQSPKYFNLIRCDRRFPSPTILATSCDNSSAGPSHPSVCRKFSIAELRRISSFPDDFVTTGSFEQQAERLGRAVPPVMMSKIAATIRDHILKKVEPR